MSTVDEVELDRHFMWTCTTCHDNNEGKTKTSAVRHVAENSDHIVMGTGTTMYKFHISLLEHYLTRPVEDVSLPMSTLHDPADRYYSDQQLDLPGESLE